MLKYEGYTGHVEFDDATDIFHGEVLDTRDVITFQGNTGQRSAAALLQTALPRIFAGTPRPSDSWHCCVRKRTIIVSF